MKQTQTKTDIVRKNKNHIENNFRVSRLYHTSLPKLKNAKPEYQIWRFLIRLFSCDYWSTYSALSPSSAFFCATVFFSGLASVSGASGPIPNAARTLASISSAVSVFSLK